MILALFLMGCRAEPAVKIDDIGDAAGDTAEDCPGGTEVCNGIDDDCDGEVDEDVTNTWYDDADADGYGNPASVEQACEQPGGTVATGNDCDDLDPDRWPGNPEVCDGVDNNCDGQVDEGVANIYFADADGDGYGDPGASAYACADAAGYVSNDADCDDTTEGANPGANETCDEIDNDCDGEVDDGVLTTYYADFDGDFWGKDDATQDACALPTGYSEDNGDCDDADGTIHPFAEEICDGLDQDCDGVADNGIDADGDGTADCLDTEICDGLDNDGDGSVDEPDAVGATTWWLDYDADGYGGTRLSQVACDQPVAYVATADDCDDTDAAVSPGVSETCNGIDDDCDGAIDNGAPGSTFYRDGDSDGYGDIGSTTTDCSAPAGYVADSTDCDDTSGAVSPAGTEICNAVDDDCDGAVDDGLVFSAYYADVDADGYGDVGSAATDCSAPVGYVVDGTDCDDGISTVHPGATEICDGVDDDCDGVVDDGAVGTSVFYADDDGDGYGDPWVAVTDCAAPAGYVSDFTDCDDGDETVYPGAVDVCDTLDNDCNGYADDAGYCPCDIEYYGGEPYMYCSTTLEWAPARAVCNTYGYELISINSAAENTWSMGIATSYGWTSGYIFWMGFNDIATEGSFVWASGDAVTYTNWNGGEPNNSGGEDCAHTWSTGTWNDIPCTGYPARYVCEP